MTSFYQASIRAESGTGSSFPVAFLRPDALITPPVSWLKWARCGTEQKQAADQSGNRRKKVAKWRTCRQADERHHAGLPVSKFASCSTDEDKTAIYENDRTENSGDEFRAGERRCVVAQPMLDLGRPKDDRDGEREAQPKLVAKHRHGVTGVTIMASVDVRDPVPSMWVGHTLVMRMERLICHFRPHYTVGIILNRHGLGRIHLNEKRATVPCGAPAADGEAYSSPETCCAACAHFILSCARQRA